jgi:hypothetical protein
MINLHIKYLQIKQNIKVIEGMNLTINELVISQDL